MISVTKEKIIRKTALDTGSTIKKSREIIDAFLRGIEDYLDLGCAVQLHNYFTFLSINKKERIGRNPRTGESMTIPAKRTVKVKVSKKLRDAVNGAPK